MKFRAIVLTVAALALGAGTAQAQPWGHPRAQIAITFAAERAQCSPQHALTAKRARCAAVEYAHVADGAAYATTLSCRVFDDVSARCSIQEAVITITPMFTGYRRIPVTISVQMEPHYLLVSENNQYFCETPSASLPPASFICG